MAMPPHAAMKAPRGPRKPKTRTEDEISSAVGAKVAQDEIAAGDAGEDAAQIDGHVGRRPEGIAADGAMPGDVPVRADGDRGDGECGAPEIPGDGAGFCSREGPGVAGGVGCRGHGDLRWYRVQGPGDRVQTAVAVAGSGYRFALIARSTAARASRRVESSVGSGEFSSLMMSGISVQPKTTASQPCSLRRVMTCWWVAMDSAEKMPLTSSSMMQRLMASRSVSLGRR